MPMVKKPDGSYEDTGPPYEGSGGGFEDPDDPYTWAETLNEPAPDVGDKIDVSDPDQKAAWLQLLTEATEAGDDEMVELLKDMVPVPEAEPVE